jgi:hypothetical protein
VPEAERAVYTFADRTLAIAMIARDGLTQAVRLAEEFPALGEDPLGDDLVSRLRACAEKLDGEVEHYRGLAGRGAAVEVPPMPLRLVQ